MKNTLLIFLIFALTNVVFGQDSLDVNTLVGNYTVKKGTIISYTGSHHASVGISFDIDVDSEYLKFIKSEMTYEKDQKTAGNGGDAAWVTYYYEVIQKGESKIEITRKFRGEIKDESNIKLKLIE